MPPSTTFIGSRDPLVDKQGMANFGFLKKLQEWDTKLNGTINLVGQIIGIINAATKIQGRTEGIGTTVTNLTSTGQFNNLDNVLNGASYQRSPLYTGTAIQVENGNFETSATLPPPGWVAFQNGVLSYETAAPQSGLRALIVTPAGLSDGAISTRRYACQPGDAFRITGYVFQTGSTDAVVRIVFYDKNDVQLAFITAFTPTTGAWTFVSATGLAPANSVYFRITLQQGNSSTNIVKFDVINASRMQTAFEVTPINTAGTPTTTTSLCTQSGVTTAINVAASTWQFGDGQVSYNSGSVDPGSFGTYYVYADDPAFAGGAVTYVATTIPSTVNAVNGRLFFGKITTTGGGGGVSTGGGSGGGGPVSKAALS